MFKDEIIKSLSNVLSSLQIKNFGEITLEHPGDFKNGDYSSNIALKIQGRDAQLDVSAKHNNPKDAANLIITKWQEMGLPEFVEKVEVAGPGFINIWLKLNHIGGQLSQVLKESDNFGKIDFLQGKKILLEHTSPNTNKSLHVGHVRNNVTGMTIARLLEFCGAEVTIDCLFNDRGIHICKAMWGFLRHESRSMNHESRISKNWEELINYWFEHQDEWPEPEDEGEKSDHFVEKFYGLGVKAEEDEGNKREMQEMLLAWENNDEKVRALWKKLNDWVYRGFEETFKQLGSRYDHGWYESDFYQQAKETLKEGLAKGVFKQLDDGAVLTNLEPVGLSDTIVQRADGTSMYFTQDIYLTKQKTEKFPSDKYIWVVGPEQQLHLKQVFAVYEQLGIGSKENFLHLWYGFVYLKGKGKMSSRSGTVISADELLVEARNLASQLIKKENISNEEIDKINVAVGTGAVKYGLLKLGRTQDIYFNWEESLNLKGNSGPYLQYTYARTQSVLIKNKACHPEPRRKSGRRIPWEDNSQRDFPLQRDPAAAATSVASLPLNDISSEEDMLLRIIYRFGEVIEESAKDYSPNILCNFLFDLAQKFNLFYDKQRIIPSSKFSPPLAGSRPKGGHVTSMESGDEKATREEPSKEQSQFRLLLTACVGQVLKNGLTILGIEPLQKM